MPEPKLILTITKVSILVLVDAALRRGGVCYMPVRRWKVSILVLVDAALRHRHDRQSLCSEPRFNPCFSGCRPATPSLAQLEEWMEFQSLF